MTTENIITIINTLFEKFGIAVDWGKDNILPYLQDLLGKVSTYKIISCSIGVVIGCVLLILGAILLKKILKEYNNLKSHKIKDGAFLDSWHEPTAIGWFTIGTIIFSFLIGLPLFFMNLIDVIKWAIIPEIQFIEYLSYLIG